MIETAISMEDKPCPLGCPPDDELVLVAKDQLNHLPGEFNIVRCRKCGLIRTNPRPTLDSIGFYYPDTYGPYQGTRVDNNQHQSFWPSWVKAIKNKIFRFHTDHLPELNPGRMLEIGCASGAFLHKMAGNGWEVEGIELSPSAAENARSLGYPVYSGSLESAPEPSNLYDMVVGWMVLEHLHEPVLALNKLRSWTKPGAWLVVSLPNAASKEFLLFGPNWYALHVPNHLYHYTPDTVKKILAEGGWRVEEIFHQRILSNLIGSMGLCWRNKRLLNKLAPALIRIPEQAGYINYIMYPVAYVLGALGQTGRMTIWARRIDYD